MAARHTNRSRGFTLIEMLIVISLVMILVAIAVPNYQRSIMRAKESVLKQDLFSLRNVIDQYKLDKQKAPQTLEDLVSAGYFKKIPVDPFTNQADWVIEQEDADNAVDPQELGINDIHSASSQTSTMGTPYSEW